MLTYQSRLTVRGLASDLIMQKCKIHIFFPPFKCNWSTIHIKMMPKFDEGKNVEQISRGNWTIKSSVFCWAPIRCWWHGTCGLPIKHAASVCLENLPDLQTNFIAPETHSPTIPNSTQIWLTLFRDQDKPWLFEYLLLQKERKQARSLQRRGRWMQHDHRVAPWNSWLRMINVRNHSWAGSLAHKHSDHWTKRKKAIQTNFLLTKL